MNNHLGNHIHNLPSAARDLAVLILGKEIGRGMSRTVYEYRLDKKYVVKVENTSCDFQNVLEWEIWQNTQYFSYVNKWLAPCKEISPCGIFLIQERTKPALKFPEKLPYFLKDNKRENYGMIGKKFVCHDYGTFLRADHFDTKRMSKVKWWDLDDEEDGT